MPRKAKPPGQQGPSADTIQRSAVQPKRAPTGLPQGEHQALMEAQAQVPLPNAGGRLQQAVDMASQAQPVGMGDMLSQPSDRPNEPVQAGLPMGPGPGPEAVPTPMAPMDPDDPEMARYLPMLEVLADRPNATMATRNFVRKLRGSLSPNITMQSMIQGGPGVTTPGPMPQTPPAPPPPPQPQEPSPPTERPT